MTEQLIDPESLARIVKENTKPEILEANVGDLEKAAFLLVPDGMRAESIKKFLDENRKTPEFRRGTIKADRLQSFIDATNRFKMKDSVLFASAAIGNNKITAKMTAILDYNPAGDDIKATANGDHRVRFDFPIAKDFAFWLSKNCVAMSQVDFALFLEERLIDMAAPNDDDKKLIDGLKPRFGDPMDILELSRDLELYSKETFRSKNKLSSGETELQFTSEHVDAKGKPVKVPDFFVIRLPIFEGGEAVRILVRLRYRLKDQSVVWFFDLYRIDNALEEAFEADAQFAKEKTDLPLFFGEPEAKVRPGYAPSDE